jgi:hypothetical protein
MGIPQGTRDLHRLRAIIQNGIACIRELQLAPTQTTVYFPADLCEPENCEIIVTVDGLFDTPQRTPAVRGDLGQHLLLLLRNFRDVYIPNCDKIEVLIQRPFNSDACCVWCKI